MSVYLFLTENQNFTEKKALEVCINNIGNKFGKTEVLIQYCDNSEKTYDYMCSDGTFPGGIKGFIGKNYLFVPENAGHLMEINGSYNWELFLAFPIYLSGGQYD